MAGAVAGSLVLPQQPDRAKAVRLRVAAVERLAQLDDDSALALYRAARAADPSYFAPQHEYMSLMQLRMRLPELRREFATTDSSSPVRLCLMTIAEQQLAGETDAPVRRLQAIEKRFGPTPCTDAFLIGDGSPTRHARTKRDSPELIGVHSTYAGVLNAKGKWQEAEKVLFAAIESANDAMQTVEVSFGRANWRMARHDTAGALVVWRWLEDFVRRDGRPGPLALYLGARCNDQYRFPGATVESRARWCRQFYAVVRPRRAWYTEWRMSRELGKAPLERGELTEALPVLTRSVLLAESLGTPGLQLDSYTLRGRAYARAGKFSLALRDLKRAIAVGPAAGDAYYLAEAYHNLAHLYEGAGRYAEAAAAADSSASIADALPRYALRYTIRHDAGVIRLAAGWHAAATRDFDAMVRVVDELGSEGHYFAAEYFERVGNLGKALEYYRVGAGKPYPDPRNFAALARVYEALGSPVSAEVAAQQHDALSDRWSVLSQPALPDLLARRGRMREAVAIADTWARRRLKAGNVEGAALAQLQLGELLLRYAQPKVALDAATRADSLTGVLKLKALRIEARTLQGRALLADGQSAAGLAALRDAVRLAAANPSTEALLETNLALGRGLELAGRRADVVAAYDRAAMAVERMTAGLNEDQHRTGFKEQHLAPFDGALRVLLTGGGSPADAEAALAWSARRKAAALTLAGAPGAGPVRRLSVASLRSRIRADEALIDYSVVDSTAWAIVVRPGSIRSFALRATSSQLATWVAAIRRPLVATPGGRIDLAHARFNVAAAESLYHALITPLRAALGNAKSLAIAPDGALWYVPFAALVTGRANGRVSYLIERHEVRLLPSAQFLGRRDGNALPAGFRVDALSYSVPGGSAELAAIRSALGETRVASRDGAGATERATLSAQAHVLHLAVHASVDDRDPLASHLRLTPAGGDDGLLHLSEVASRRASPHLVVLTACEAVSGRLYAGEGLVGLARAFLMSGARLVIASGWPVAASAAELTGVLYREMAAGRSPPAALRSAQLALIQKPETAHPIHWAGFVAFDGGAGNPPR